MRLQDKNLSLCTTSLLLSSLCSRIKIQTPPTGTSSSTRERTRGRDCSQRKKLPFSDSSHLNLLNRVIKPQAKALHVYQCVLIALGLVFTISRETCCPENRECQALLSGAHLAKILFHGKNYLGKVMQQDAKGQILGTVGKMTPPHFI